MYHKTVSVFSQDPKHASRVSFRLHAQAAESLVESGHARPLTDKPVEKIRAIVLTEKGKSTPAPWSKVQDEQLAPGHTCQVMVLKLGNGQVKRV